MAVHHLLEVSVCLLGVCVVLCLAASLTRSLTRRHHWNGLDLQNVITNSYTAAVLLTVLLLTGSLLISVYSLAFFLTTYKYLSFLRNVRNDCDITPLFYFSAGPID